MANPWEMNWSAPADVPASVPASSEAAPWDMKWAPEPVAEVAPPARTTTPAQQLLTDFQNQGLAAGQRTTPVISAQQKNLLSADVQEGDDGNAYFVDPSNGKLVLTDSNKHVILRDPADNKLKVYGRTADTDEGALSAAGRLLGTGMATGTVAPMSKAVPAALSAAERIGVDLPVGIATESPIAGFAAQVAARAPGGGPMLKALDESKEALRGSAFRAAEMSGGTRDAAVAGDNYASAIENSFKPTVKSGVSAAYDNLSALMNPDVKTPLSQTKNSVDIIKSRRGESALQGAGKAASTVEEALSREGGLTFEGIKGLRTHVGEMLDGGILPEGMSQTELRSIYAGLSDDLKSAAQNAGGSRAVLALERANELNKQVSDWKDGIRKVLGPSTRSGEGISNAIIRMASSSVSGDIETLAKARSAVPKEVWQDIASTAIGRLGVSRNGEWTPAAFATDFRKLSDRGRALLFRSVGSGDVLPFLDDIAKVSQQFVDRGKLANTSGTAGHNALYAAGGAIVAGVTTGRWEPPLIAIGGIVGANGMSRLLARPATAASVARWSRVYSAFAKSPTPASQARLELASRNLSNTAAANGVTIEPSEIMRSLQSPSGAKADDEQNVPRPPTSQ